MVLPSCAGLVGLVARLQDVTVMGDLVQKRGGHLRVARQIGQLVHHLAQSTALEAGFAFFSSGFHRL